VSAVAEAPPAAPAPALPVTIIEPGRHAGHDDQLKRVVTLAWTLAITDFKLRFYGSVLGIVWTLARPFAFFGVVYLVFTEIIGLDKSVDHYGVYILFGLVLFNFFAEITNSSVQALTVRENLLRKMHFPPIVIPLAVVLTALLNLGMTLVAVVIFVLANGIWPDWGWLEIFPLVLFLAIFAGGIGMFLSATYVRYRDVAPIWEVFAQLIFYATPVLYVVTRVPGSYQRKMLANPLAAVLTQVRHAIVDPKAPSLGAVMGSDWRMLIPLGIVVFCFVAVFRRASPKIAENL
jgi:ABC-2 type transport system permease protein